MWCRTLGGRASIDQGDDEANRQAGSQPHAPPGAHRRLHQSIEHSRFEDEH